MEKLKRQLDGLMSDLESKKEEQLHQRLNDLTSVFPFNEYEYVISSLMGLGKLSLDDYYELRDEYISRNMFLYIFEISAPRGFGETWAQGHLKGLVPELVKPSKKRDPSYSGQYDFYLDEKIRVEVKASRAVDFNSREALPAKALPADSDKQFDMNFQQTKPSCCDVFIWVGVWRDVIRYWVLASEEVANNKYFSKGQHRGNVGEGQLHLTKDNIGEFSKYEAKSNCLLKVINEAYKRQMKNKKVQTR